MTPQFNNGAYYGYDVQGSFSPGQVIQMGDNPLSLNMNGSHAENPFSPIGESPMTPMSANTATPTTAHPEQASLVRKSSSVHPYVTRHANPGEFAPPEQDYVDLSRSSVTPFQAAQYAEISRRLNTVPPQPMATPVLASVAENMSYGNERSAPPMPANTPPLDVGQNVSVGLVAARAIGEHSLPESPFADPTHTRTSAVDPDEVAMPQPPSPAFSSSSRVTSSPPVLPEINVPHRAFSPVQYDMSASPRNPPSKLSNSVTTPAAAHLANHYGTFADVPKTPTADSPPVTPRHNVLEAKRPETFYDDEDAYGGI